MVLLVKVGSIRDEHKRIIGHDNFFLLSKNNTKHWYIQSVHEYIDRLEKDIEA